MSRARFNVSYEIVTPESAEHGEADEQGYVCEGEPLRDAIKAFHGTRTNEVDGVQGFDTDAIAGMPRAAGNRPRLVVITNGLEFRTGAQESRCLVIPETVSAASAWRIARLARGK